VGYGVEPGTPAGPSRRKPASPTFLKMKYCLSKERIRRIPKLSTLLLEYSLLDFYLFYNNKYIVGYLVNITMISNDSGVGTR
jgi:hypothetical protein